MEEQFYLLLPLGLLWLHRRRPNWLRPALIVVALASFALSAVTIGPHPDATFYLIPQRAWELLVGGLVGLRVTRYPKGQLSRELMAAFGLVIVVLFLVWVPGWRFPDRLFFLSALALRCCSAAGEDGSSFAGRLLSRPPLVGIGLISYSTYLWHLPLIVLQRADTSIVFGHVLPKIFPFLTSSQSLTLERTALLVSLSLLLGALSWKFIEQPVRFGRLRPTRTVLFAGSGAVAATIIAAALAVLVGNGFPARFQKDVLQIVSYPEPTQHFKDGICLPDVASRYDAANCRNPVAGKTNWILFGDSHALVLDYGFTEVFPEVNLMLFGVPACPPYPTRRAGDRSGCFPYYDAFYHDYLPKHPVDLVIFSANWQPADMARVGETIAYLRSIHQKVVLIGPIMHYDAPLRFLLASAVMRHDPGLPARHRMLAFDEMDRQMAKLARDEWHVPYFSYSVFCPNGQCLEWAGKNVPLQWDQAHLLEDGSVVAARVMRESGLFSVGAAAPPSPPSPYVAEESFCFQHFTAWKSFKFL